MDLVHQGVDHLALVHGEELEVVPVAGTEQEGLQLLAKLLLLREEVQNLESDYQVVSLARLVLPHPHQQFQQGSHTILVHQLRSRSDHGLFSL